MQRIEQAVVLTVMVGGGHTKGEHFYVPLVARQAFSAQGLARIEARFRMHGM